jgi:putative ABC transport system permease protein
MQLWKDASPEQVLVGQGVLNRKLLREVRHSRWTLVAVAGIIVCGVACLVSMGFSYRNLQNAKADYYVQCRMADFWLDVKKVPLPEVERLFEIRGLEEVRSRIQFFAIADLPHAKKPISGQVLSLPDHPRSVINDIYLRTGSYFTDQRANEVIVNDAFAKAHDLKPGDWVHLLLNNRRQELFIVGTAGSSEFVYLLGPGAIMPDPQNFGVFYLKRSYAEDIFDFQGAANNIVGRLSPEWRSKAKTRLFLQRAENRLEDYGVFSKMPLADQPSNRYLTQEIEGLRAFAVLMPSLFLIVAALVLNVLLSRMVDQERAVIGTLKALGYTSSGIIWHYVKFGVTVGLVGGAGGVLLGYLLSIAMTKEYRHFFEFPDLRFRFYFDLAAIGMLVSILFAGIGCLLGLRGVLRLNPAQAMRPKPPVGGGRVVLEKLPFFWRWLNTAWRMTLREMFRSYVRTFAGLVATSMGAGLMVSGFMMSDATFFLIDFQFRKVQRSDFDLTLRDQHHRRVVDEARRLPGVIDAEPKLSIAGTFYHGPYEYKSALTGLIPHATMTVPHDTAGRPVKVPKSGVLLSLKLAELLHVRPGDTIVFQPSRGERKRHQVTVSAISKGYFGISAFGDITWLSRLVDENYAVTGIQLRTDHHRQTEDALYAELKELPSLESVYSRQETLEAFNTKVLDLMWVFIGMLIGFAGVVFFGAILNASLVALSERKREMATLSALGYSNAKLAGLFFRESLVISLLGTLLGLPLGYAFSVMISLAYDTELIRFPVVWKNETAFWTFLLAIAFTVLAQVGVRRMIFRTDWLEALQSKE